MTGRAAHLQQTIKQGEELVADNHFGADKIKERIKDIQVRRTCAAVTHDTIESPPVLNAFPPTSRRNSGRLWSISPLSVRPACRRPATSTSSR